MRIASQVHSFCALLIVPTAGMLAAPSTAEASVVLVSQNRYVSVFFPGFPGTTHTAPDFNPFSDAVSLTIDSFSGASASQTSTLSPNGFTFTGRTSGSRGVLGKSYLIVTFDVVANQSFAMEARATEGGVEGYIDAMLTGPGGTVFNFRDFTTTSAAATMSGVLFPGQYVLTVGSEQAGLGSNGVFTSGGNFTMAVPAPSALIAMAPIAAAGLRRRRR